MNNFTKQEFIFMRLWSENISSSKHKFLQTPAQLLFGLIRASTYHPRRDVASYFRAVVGPFREAFLIKLTKNKYFPIKRRRRGGTSARTKMNLFRSSKGCWNSIIWIFSFVCDLQHETFILVLGKRLNGISIFFFLMLSASFFEGISFQK